MKVKVSAVAEVVVRNAAAVISTAVREAVDARERFVVAVNGRHTPWLMLRALARENVSWEGGN